MAWTDIYGITSLALAAFFALQAYLASKNVNLVDGKTNVLAKATQFFYLVLAVGVLITASGMSTLAIEGDYQNTTISTTTNTLHTYANVTTNSSQYNSTGSFNASVISQVPVLLYTNQTTNTTTVTTNTNAGALALSDSNTVVLNYLLYVLFAMFFIGLLLSLYELTKEWYVKGQIGRFW